MPLSKLILHIKRTRKSAYLLISLCLFFPVTYLIITRNNGTFDITFFQSLLPATLVAGVALSFTMVTADYYLTERLKNILVGMNLGKLGDKNLQITDQYNGWSRALKIEGSYDNRKVSIDHRFEKGNWGNIPYLTIAIEPHYRIILEIKVNRDLTAGDLDTRIREVLAKM